MKIVSLNQNEVVLETSYEALALINNALSVPLYATDRPDFEKNVGASQSFIERLVEKISSLMHSIGDENEGFAFLGSDNKQKNKEQLKIVVKLSIVELPILSKAFKESCLITKEFDDFNTLTGYTWEDAEYLQKELESIVAQIEKV